MPVRYLPSNIIMGCVPCKSNTKLDEKPLNEEIDSGEQEERYQEVLTYYRAENQIFKVTLTRENKSKSMY